jgi:hypothetical protein
VIGSIAPDVGKSPRFHTIVCPATVEQSAPADGVPSVETETGAGVPGTNVKHPFGRVTVSVVPTAYRVSVTETFPVVIVGVSVTCAVAPGLTLVATKLIAFLTIAVECVARDE